MWEEEARSFVTENKRALAIKADGQGCDHRNIFK